jgi:D-glycero-alpha-D-manno-heptose-7-phosphate kinase
MIISRSPLRVTLGGGGTDLPSYYREHGGFLISAAIDKYVYVAINRPFVQGIFLKYSHLEKVKQVSEIENRIIREVLELECLRTPQIEISSMADIPAGTGLGSSGSFTTALIKALYGFRRKHIHQEALAELACHIELERLKEPIGKQDQYIASIGGITCLEFCQSGRVVASPLNIDMKTMFELEDNLLLFFTGFSRSASHILKDQDDRSKGSDEDMLKNLHYVKELGFRSKLALENGDIALFGELMHEHWQNKKQRSAGMSNSQIDDWYELGKKNGACGGKLVGAGGGGFLMFLASDRTKLRTAMQQVGLEEVRFKFDFEGTKMVLSS